MSFHNDDSFNKQYAEVVGVKKVKQLEKRGHLTAQILRYRHKNNMTQQQLAEAVKMSKSTIGRIEAGLTDPNYKTLVALSDALGAPLVIDAAQEVE